MVDSLKPTQTLCWAISESASHAEVNLSLLQICADHDSCLPGRASLSTLNFIGKSMHAEMHMEASCTASFYGVQGKSFMILHQKSWVAYAQVYLAFVYQSYMVAYYKSDVWPSRRDTNAKKMHLQDDQDTQLEKYNHCYCLDITHVVILYTMNIIIMFIVIVTIFIIIVIIIIIIITIVIS